MELVPLASAVVGVLGGIVRLLNGGAGGKSGSKAESEVKLTLTPPLFERHRDRNSTVRSPLDAHDTHRTALFHAFFADQHALIATAQLQPVQANNVHVSILHSARRLRLCPTALRCAELTAGLPMCGLPSVQDVEAVIRVPSSSVPLFPFSSLRSPLKAGAAAASALPAPSLLSAAVDGGAAQSSSDSPVADAVIRVQPSPREPTFLQFTLSTAHGGVANALGCYALTSHSARVTAAPSTEAGSDGDSSRSSSRPLPPSSLSSAASSAGPHAAVFFQAALFSNDQQHQPQQQPQTQAQPCEDGGSVGVRVDHLGSSLGVSVCPLWPSRVSGWLSSSTFLSSTRNTALRGGCSFTADADAMSAAAWDRAVQVDGQLSYLQLVDADVDELSAEEPQSAVPAYEVGVTLRNGGEELVTSFFNHLVVRRRVYNWWEDKRVVGIINYCDLGLELCMKKAAPPSWRLALSWQLNKNALVKTRLTDRTASAAVALKSWQSPNTTVSVAAHYDYGGHVRMGLTLALENVGAILFGRTPPQYTRTVSSRRKDVTWEWQQHPDRF